MQKPGRVHLPTLIALIALASGCGTTPPGSSIIKTLHEAYDAAPFGNVLVISVAGDIPTRVEFEQRLAAAISVDETPATAYYTVVGRNPQLNRGVLNNVVEARKFDAIILTRIKGQDRADLAPNRPTGRFFDLYLYDYEELNIPERISIGSTVSFVVEVYDTRAKRKVWAIESLMFKSKSVDAVVSQQAANIAAEILQDGLIVQ